MGYISTIGPRFNAHQARVRKELDAKWKELDMICEEWPDIRTAHGIWSGRTKTAARRVFRTAGKFKKMLVYTGDPCDLCAITFASAGELARPVGFDARHAFECEDIVEWLTRHRKTNPRTGKDYGSLPVHRILHPLVVNGRAEHVASTQWILNWVESADRKDAMLRVANKVGCDMALFLLVVYCRAFAHAWPFQACLVTLCTVISGIQWQYPARGSMVVAVYFMIAGFYTSLGITCGVFSPHVTMTMIVHLWCIQLFAVKVALDVNTEAFGANIR